MLRKAATGKSVATTKALFTAPAGAANGLHPAYLTPTCSVSYGISTTVWGVHYGTSMFTVTRMNMRFGLNYL
jgi:hypothetical protein